MIIVIRFINLKQEELSMTLHDYQMQQCSLCNWQEYAQLPFTEQSFGSDQKSAMFICKNCSMTRYFSNYKLDYKHLLEHEYYLDHDQGEYSAKRSLEGEKAYRKNIIDNLQWVMDELKLKKNDKLLDIGCGEAVFIEEAIKLGFVAEGIEPSKEQCIKHHQRGLVVHQGLLKDYRGKFNDQFDIITLLWVLDSLENPVEDLHIIHDMLKKDGHLIIMISTMLDNSMYRYKYGIPIPHQKNFKGILPQKTTIVAHAYYYTRQVLQTLMSVSGFGFVKEKSNDGLKPVFIFKKAEPMKKSFDIHHHWKTLYVKFIFWYWSDKLYRPIFEKISKLKGI